MVPDGNLGGGLGWKNAEKEGRQSPKKTQSTLPQKKTSTTREGKGVEETKKKKDKHPSKTRARKGREEK